MFPTPVFEVSFLFIYFRPQSDEVVYAKEKEIKEIEKAPGIFEGKEKEEELEEVVETVVAQEAVKNLDGETAGRLIV